MTTTIDRLARVLLNRRGLYVGEKAAHWDDHMQWYREGLARGDISAQNCELHTAFEEARAILREMREPPKGIGVPLNNPTLEGYFTAVIDHILAETP